LNMSASVHAWQLSWGARSSVRSCIIQAALVDACSVLPPPLSRWCHLGLTSFF
jgi:hypothetical protein